MFYTLGILGIILLIITGLLVGLIASMLGIGGGVLVVPILILLFHVDPLSATAISSFVIIFTSSSGLYVFARNKRIDYIAGLTLILLAIPASFLGATAATHIDRTLLREIFGYSLLLMAFYKFYTLTKNNNDNTASDADKPKRKTFGPLSYHITQEKKLPDGTISKYTFDATELGLFALIAGFAAGLLGIGGGIIFVPLLFMIGGLPMHIATATSTFAVLFTSLTATWVKSQIVGWHTILLFGIPLAIGTITGAQIGARSVGRVKAKHLQYLFWGLVILVALRLIIQL